MYIINKKSYAVTQYGVIVKCSSRKDAIEQTRDHDSFNKWSSLGKQWGQTKIYFQYPGCPPMHGEKIPGLTMLTGHKAEANNENNLGYMANYSNSVTFSNLEIQTNLPLSRNILKGLDIIAENPDDRYFIHKANKSLALDTMQIACTESCASLIIGGTVQQAVNRRRSDYTYQGDLYRVLDDLRSLDVGNFDRPKEIRWRMKSPITGADWRLNVSQYSIIDIVNDQIFILCKTITADPIASPELLTV